MNNVYSKPISRNSEFSAMKPVLKVVGMGGGGSNAINRMIELGLKGVDFIAVNTDAQALQSNLAPTKIQIGPLITRGLGAGGNPQVGFEAAKESVEDLSYALQGADMVFLTAGMGGGTGTGSIAIAAQAARNVGAVTVAIVTTPFSFEMGRRQRNAQEGLSRLRQHVDTLITIPNDRLLKIAPRNLPLDMAFRLADDVLRQGIQGISELINQTGYINVDFSHIRQLMKAGGGSLLSIGIGKGKDKAKQAIHNALNHPLLEAVNIQNASGIIANFTASEDLSFFEVTEALTHLAEQTNTNADIIPGLIMDHKLNDRCEVILVITGLGATPLDASMNQVTKPEQREQFSMRTSQKVVQNQFREPAEALVSDENLDIPAFLRRRRFQ
ncbi:MAG: cell division protein FtsZ [Anaerolineaceae bacterium]|nr:cell division protein FtsZ [Anaerolineaceae bacterium]